MKAKIYPSLLRGEAIAPPSKSYTHRALLASAFAPGRSILIRPLWSDDIRETISSLEKLGARFEISKDKITVQGIEPKPLPSISLEILASGSTLRLLVPILSSFIQRIEIRTNPRMLERVKTPDIVQLSGLSFDFQDSRLTVSGRLTGGSYRIDPILTTQWLSGMILALPFLPFGTEIATDHPLFGNTYPALARAVAEAFGISFRYCNGSLSLEKEGKYRSTEFQVEGDYSAAANWLAAGMFSSELRVGGLNPASLQPDFLFFEHLRALGAEYKFDNGYYSCAEGTPCPARLDISLTPDLFPILAALAAARPSETRFAGLDKLKYKESDRAKMMAEGLRKLGAEVKYEGNEVAVKGKTELEGGAEIDAAGDHRLIMAFMMLSGKIKKPFIIDSCEGVSKSYPEFFETYLALGGKMELL